MSFALLCCALHSWVMIVKRRGYLLPQVTACDFVWSAPRLESTIDSLDDRDLVELKVEHAWKGICEVGDR